MEIRGIAILGLNGAGKSTLAHALSKEKGYFEMDVEDYYFPEQKQSRRRVLEDCVASAKSDADGIPFAHARTKDEVQRALLVDMEAHPKFILSGVTMNWCEDILSRLDIAFWIQTPLEKRLDRIMQRDERRFGARVLPGGDLYDQQMQFRSMAQNRSDKMIEDSAMNLGCPVIILDGTLPVQELVRIALQKL